VKPVFAQGQTKARSHFYLFNKKKQTLTSKIKHTHHTKQKNTAKHTQNPMSK